LRQNNKRKNLESMEARALMQWVSAVHIEALRKWLFHIPNGGSRNIIEATKLKAEGVKKGVSDYFLPFPMHRRHGLWIELKKNDKKTARITLEQQTWIDDMHMLGYAVTVAYGWSEAREEILSYLTCGQTRYESKRKWS
jgi:hypothetical protein